MRKILTTIIFVCFACFYSCSNSISGTEWVNVSSDTSIKFIDETNALIKAGSAGNINVTYKYKKPKIVLSSSGATDMHGVIKDNTMTFYNTSNNAVFVKK